MISDSIFYTYMDSPLGRILVAQNSVGLVAIDFQEGLAAKSPEAAWHFQKKLDGDAVDQLQAYFNGELYQFTLPLAPKGTLFQQQVWKALQSIPYGQTISYGELARKIGLPTAARAVGAANGKNPLCIIVPCHRVIGSNGTLTGFRGGVRLKEGLLSLERRHSAKSSLQLTMALVNS